MRNKKLDARLEIRLDPEQLNKLKKEAAAKSTSVGELVREAIEQRYTVSRDDKLKAVQEMANINAPVSNWEQMKKVFQMYAASKDHPLKVSCLEIMSSIAHGNLDAYTDAEVFQEILYRYFSINRHELGLQVFDSYSQIMHGSVLPVRHEDMLLARELAYNKSGAKLSPRDLVHIAVMFNNGIDHIITSNRDFEKVIWKEPGYCAEPPPPFILRRMKSAKPSYPICPRKQPRTQIYNAFIGFIVSPKNSIVHVNAGFKVAGNGFVRLATKRRMARIIL